MIVRLLMSSKNIFTLEKEKYTTDDEGNTTIRTVGTDGDNGGTEAMDIKQLAKDAFTTDDAAKLL